MWTGSYRQYTTYLALVILAGFSHRARTQPAGEPVSPGQTEPVFEDDFERGNRTGAQHGYAWIGNPRKVAVSDEIAHGGTYSLKFRFLGKPRCLDDQAEQRFRLGRELKAVWVEFWIYYPNGTEGLGARYMHRMPTRRNRDGSCTNATDRGTNNKFFHLWDVDYQKNHTGAILETRTAPNLNGDSYMDPIWETDWDPTGNHGARLQPAITDNASGTIRRGHWTQIRIVSQVASDMNTPNGYIKVWIDGALRINFQNIKLAASPGGNNFWRHGYLLGWSNSGFDANTNIYIDDFKIYDQDPGW